MIFLSVGWCLRNAVLNQAGSANGVQPWELRQYAMLAVLLAHRRCWAAALARDHQLLALLIRHRKKKKKSVDFGS